MNKPKGNNNMTVHHVSALIGSLSADSINRKLLRRVGFDRFRRPIFT
ncbi:MAG: hypothetical protein KIT69_01930 [Propionibacteriaceae bacterium]|nr:hypothetical protein [Propionibacteriaceae bacterium]